MAITATEDRFIISIPRLTGYKTLVTNIALIVVGLASAIWPRITTPDPAAIGILFDQGTGLVVAIVGIVNAALRLQSTGPAGPFKPAKVGTAGGGGAEAGEVPAPIAMPLAAHLASLAHVSNVTVAKALEGDRAFSSAVPPTEVEWSRKAKDRFGPFPMARLTWSSAQAFLAAFMLPSFFLFAGTAIATMPGCASVQQINAIAQAETVEQRAFAAYGTFVVMEERAADIIGDKHIPKAARQRVQALDRVAKPAADALISLARQLKAARNRMSVAEIGSTSGQVASLSDELASSLVAFGPKLSALVSAVNSVKR